MRGLVFCLVSASAFLPTLRHDARPRTPSLSALDAQSALDVQSVVSQGDEQPVVSQGDDRTPESCPRKRKRDKIAGLLRPAPSRPEGDGPPGDLAPKRSPLARALKFETLAARQSRKDAAKKEALTSAIDARLAPTIDALKFENAMLKAALHKQETRLREHSASLQSQQATIREIGDTVRAMLRTPTTAAQQWDADRTSHHLSLSNDNRIVESVDAPGIGAAIGLRGFDSGRHSWRLRQLRGDMYFMVGVAAEGFDVDGQTYQQAEDGLCWCWDLFADRYYPGDSEAHLSSYRVGAVITITLDCDQGTLAFAGDSRVQEVAFNSHALRGRRLWPFLRIASYEPGNRFELVNS